MLAGVRLYRADESEHLVLVEPNSQIPIRSERGDESLVKAIFEVDPSAKIQFGLDRAWIMTDV